MVTQHSLILYTNQKQIAATIDAYLKGTSFVIKGISGRSEEIITLLKHHAPDFLIINFTHPCLNPNIHHLKIASPRTRIIITEEGCNLDRIFGLIQAGADSFLSVPFCCEDILKILNSLSHDEIFLPPFVAKSILQKSQEFHQDLHEYPFILTEKERSILWCLSKGINVDEIKIYLGIDEDRINAHLTNILQKIHLSEIVRNFFNEKLIEVKNENSQFELI